MTFTKPSEVWKWADETGLKQIRKHLHDDGGYCARGVVGKVMGLSDYKLERGMEAYDTIRRFDDLEGLNYDLVHIYGYGITGLNDKEGWSFKDFATVAEMLGY